MAVVVTEGATCGRFRVGYLNDRSAVEKAVSGGASLESSAEATQGGVVLPGLPQLSVRAFITLMARLAACIAIRKAHSATAAAQDETHGRVGVNFCQTLVVQGIEYASGHVPRQKGDEDANDFPFRRCSDEDDRKPEGYIKIKCWCADGGKVSDQH
jgi:hypothetical protein